MEDDSAENLLDRAAFLATLRQIHTKYVDKDTNIMTFSLADVRMEGTETDTMIHHGLVLTDIVREALRVFDEPDSGTVVDDYNLDWNAIAKNNSGWKNCIGVSGSFPLKLLEHILKFTYDGSLRYRWKKFPEEWIFSDFDLFIGGEIGNDEEMFLEFSEQLEHSLRDEADFYDVPVVFCRTRERVYSKREPAQVTDISFAYLYPQFQLVQSAEMETILDIVNDFDIDVVKVILNPLTGLIHAHMDTVLAILEGTATAGDFILSHSAPSKKDISLVSSTLARMEKYNTRGYSFSRYPALTMEPNTTEDSDDDGSNPVQARFRDYLSGRDGDESDGSDSDGLSLSSKMED